MAKWTYKLVLPNGWYVYRHGEFMGHFDTWGAAARFMRVQDKRDAGIDTNA